MRYRQKQNQILVQSVLGVLKCLFSSPFGVAKRFSHFFSTPWLKLRGSNSSSCDVSRRGKTVLKYPIKKKKKTFKGKPATERKQPVFVCVFVGDYKASRNSIYANCAGRVHNKFEIYALYKESRRSNRERELLCTRKVHTRTITHAKIE